MAFIRAHAFILGLVSAVVVGGGAMAALKVVVSGDVGELLEKRTNVSKTLKGLKNKPLVNAKVLARETQRVEREKVAAQKAIDLNVIWNRGGHKLLQLTYDPLPLEDGPKKTINAFPIQSEEYDAFSLRYDYIQAYHRELAGLLVDLEATQAPTLKEVEAEVARVERKLLAKQAAEDRKSLGASGASTVSASRDPFASKGGMPPEAFGGKGPMPGFGKVGMGPSLKRGSGSASGSISAKAQKDGLESIRLKRAKMGRVYADMAAFVDPVFGVNDSEADDIQLWQAQVQLWVAREVIEAIRETNDQVLAKLPEERRNVIDAPVKHLVSLQVDRDYHIGSGKPKTGKTSARPSKLRAIPTMDKMGGFGDMSPAVGQRRTSRASGTSDLTQRSCCKDYDVVHYEFTVVLPMNRVQDLQMNLLKRNNHTILNFNVASAVANSGAFGRSADQSYHYYGTSPVVEVTMSCELLFMTSWERGTYDQQQKKWSDQFPPLMPVAVLRNLNELVPDALRKEDRDRLEEKL